MTSPTRAPSIDDDKFLFISNAKKRKYFQVSLTGSQTPNKCPSSILTEKSTVHIPFVCLAQWTDNDEGIAVEDIFNIQAVYVSGKPSCSFDTRKLSNTREKLVSLIDRTMSLSVALVDRTLHNDFTSASMNVRFVPHIFIEKTSMVLNGQQTSQIIDVFGSYSQLSGLKVIFVL